MALSKNLTPNIGARLEALEPGWKQGEKTTNRQLAPAFSYPRLQTNFVNSIIIELDEINHDLCRDTFLSVPKTSK